jgi:hypothetical protein
LECKKKNPVGKATNSKYRSKFAARQIWVKDS